MAGVLFIICIPTEEYEILIENNDDGNNVNNAVNVSVYMNIKCCIK